MNKLSVKYIQEKLNDRFSNHKYHLNNSYIFDWEADYFSISTSNYAYEVEIKLSKSDFQADFKKKKHTLFKEVKENKSRARKLPHKFYFACPVNLIDKKDVPAYAGLLYLDDKYGEIITIKEAPFLHKREYNLDKILLEKFYWRTKNLKVEIDQLNDQIKKLELTNKK